MAIIKQSATRIRIIKLGGGFVASIYMKRTPLAFFSTRFDVVIQAPVNCNTLPGRSLIQNSVVGGVTLGSKEEAEQWARDWTPEIMLLDCPVIMEAARKILLAAKT